MRPDTAALVIHDLKNALGALEAELGLLAAGADDTADRSAANATADAAQADRARRSHQQCTELRQRFVQFLAVYAAGEQMRAHCNDESPRELLETVALAHRPSSAGSGAAHRVEVRLAIDDDTPPFWYFDRRLVRMALDAALHNALRFAHGEVVLAARGIDGHLVFSVSDDGPGLGAVDPSEDSTGLGTALCEAVAAAHSSAARQGRVVLANGPVRGACFELWLA